MQSHNNDMGTAKLSKGYTINNKRSYSEGIGRVIRWSLLLCLFVILILAGTAFGYLSRMHVDAFSEGVGLGMEWSMDCRGVTSFYRKTGNPKGAETAVPISTIRFPLLLLLPWMNS